MNVTHSSPRPLTARLRWYGEIVVRRAGAAALGAAVVLIAMLTADVLWLAPSQREAQARVAESRTRLHKLAGLAGPAPRRPVAGDEPQGFALAIGRVFAVLHDNGLRAGDVRYQLTRPKGGGAQRLALTLPLTGTYPDLRKALGDLGAMPGGDIDTLTIERKNVSDAQVVASVRLTLREDGR